MAPWKTSTFAVLVLSTCISLASGFLATSPPMQARKLDPIYSTEPAVDSEPVVPDNKVLASEVKFWTALEQVFKGGLRKRDFFRSRYYRIAKKLNPDTDCSGDECLVELQASNDPVGVALALESTYGKNWWQHSWQRNNLVAKIFPTTKADGPTAKV